MHRSDLRAANLTANYCRVASGSFASPFSESHGLRPIASYRAAGYSVQDTVDVPCGLIIAIVRITPGDSPRSVIETRRGVLICIRMHSR